MGQEINNTSFTEANFRTFENRLKQETQLLNEMLVNNEFDNTSSVTGFELEGWLVDHNYFPAPINQKFLEWINDPSVVSELSRFNIELNSSAQPLKKNTLSLLQLELQKTCSKCQQTANAMGAAAIFIGTLPVLRNSDLTMANMSPMKRYRALNDQILKARHNNPIKLDISGREHLSITHRDVMLEAATTSFQVHLQTPIDTFVRHFNASAILSAPIIAATANSPYLFGTDLWNETRIPLFENAMATVGTEGNVRVSFGEGYINSPDDFFHYNQSQHPVLLPIMFDSPNNELKHLRLHNGTIWRWNRPLIGFNDMGKPHIRIEHRIMPAGPSIVDMIANAALYLGASSFMASMPDAPETLLPFEKTRSNFYEAARKGLDAHIIWLHNKTYSVRDLLLEQIIPMADTGLQTLGIDDVDRDYYMGILRARIESRQTGAQWQRSFIKINGADFLNMTANYLHHQQSGKPVHEWEL